LTALSSQVSSAIATQEIVKDLQAVLAKMTEIAADLRKRQDEKAMLDVR